MPTTYTPTQYRSNDPYQQRVLQFSTQDSRVYLSRVSNQILKGFGNDAVISGFDLISSTFIGDIFEVVINSGVLVQDTTLIEVTEQSTLSIDVSGLDDCNGYLLVYTDYKYIESIGLNKFTLKLAHVSNNGLTLMTDLSPVSWIPDRNRIYLNAFTFTKASTNTSLEKTFPTSLYLGGTNYNRRGGQLNFHRTDDAYPSVSPFFHQLPHKYSLLDAKKLITQLRSYDGNVVSITNLQLQSEYISISVDEYKPFTDPYKLIVSNPNDSYDFTVLSMNIPTSGSSVGDYILEHDLAQQYLLVEVYDVNGNLFRPNYINFTDENNLTINFNNVISDLSSSYTVILVKNNISVTNVEVEDDDMLIEIIHDLGKYYLIHQLIDPADNLYSSNRSIFNITDRNSIDFDTTICDIIEGTYKLVVYYTPEYTYNLYQTDIYNVNHNLFVEKIRDDNVENGLLYIDHNFNDLFPAVGLIENDFTISYPSDIEVIDEDQVCVSLTSLTSGSSGTVDIDSLAAFVYSFEGNNVYSLTSLTSGSSGVDNNQTYLLDVSDDNFVNPIFQVYDSNDKVIIPDYIFERIVDKEYSFEFPVGFDPTGVNILAVQGFYSYTTSLITSSDLAPVLITHNLNSLYLFVSIFDESTGELIYPQDITINNIVSLTLTTINLTPLRDYKVVVVTGIKRQAISYSKDNSYYIEFTDDDFDVLTSSITITHSLNAVCPVIQLYDEDNYQVYPSEVKIIDSDSIKITFPEDIELSPYYKAIVIKPN